MKHKKHALFVVAALGLLGACGSGEEEGDTRPWQLVFSDEFDGATVDPAKWTVETGSGFGTGQRDYDTERPENMQLTDGHLVITARKEKFQGAEYTSGRMKTAGKFARTYGRFEARLKLPQGQGMWPAFWLLGQNYEKAGWPGCGEIDVMENRGSELSTVHGSLHGPGYSGGAALSKAFVLQNGAFKDDFHTFAIEWEPGVVRWYVDDQLYSKQEAQLLSRDKEWVFNQPFFMIINLAVGGQFGGDPNAATEFPQSMMVDYVRVYSRGGE